MSGTKGRSGGKPKLRSKKVLAGTFRKDRDSGALPAVYALPDCPKYIDGRALEIWNHLILILGPTGRNVLTEGDALSLSVLAQSHALYEEKPTAQREASLRAMWALFGLTPADRQRIAPVSAPGDAANVIKPRDRGNG